MTALTAGAGTTKLPAVVTSVSTLPGQVVAVTVAYNDGTTGTFTLPRTYATLEGVRLSATAVATIMELAAEDTAWRDPKTGSYGGS